MIIWLNGTFGVGKTSTAERLAALVPGSRVFDPETVGFMLRANLGDRPVRDFQDWDAWRPLVAAALTEISRMTGEHVIAPQTVLKREYLEQILSALRAEDVEVRHVVLDAADAVLRRRVEGSSEAKEWRLAHLDEYTAARSWLVEEADLVVDTAASTPAQIARRIVTGIPDLPARPEAARKPATVKASPVKTDAVKTDAVKTDATVKADAVKADAVKTDATVKTDAVKADAVKADAVKTDGAGKAEATRKAGPGRKPGLTQQPGLADHR